MAGVLIAQNAITMEQDRKRREQDRKRRFASIGRDQLFIKSSDPIDKIGNNISKTRENWLYKNGSIYEKKNRVFSIKYAITAIAVTTVISLFLDITWETFLNNKYPFSNPSPFHSLEKVIEISVIAGFFIGIFSAGNERISYIKLTPLDRYVDSSNCGTSILIKIYDLRGYRNIDDDELDNVISNISGIIE